MQTTEKETEKLYIHFKQDSHYMPVEDYEQVIKSVKNVFYNVTKDIIKTNEVDLVVYAPQEGSLIATLGLIFAGGAFAVTTMSFILQFIESETGKHIIKRLMKKDVIEIVDEKIDKIIFVKMFIEAIFLTTQDELKTIIEEIEKFNKDITALDKSLKAVSDFYILCNKNKQIDAIGFSKEENFPITKNDFYSHMTNDIVRDKGLHCEYKKLTIVKPVIKRDSINKWTLSEVGTKDEQSYSMEDIIFKEKTLNGDFVKQGIDDDEIIALTEYKLETKNGIEKPKDRKIMEVYLFNGNKFENRELPTDFELNNAKLKADLTGQLNLFEQNIEGDKDA